MHSYLASTMRAVAAAVVALLAVFAFAVPANAATGLQSVAHRGDKQFHPENTIAAITSAVDKGADWVEIDVHYNPQGNAFFLAHDNSCSGPGGSAKIDRDSAEVVTARCALPELGSVLDSFAQRGYTSFVIEFKSTSNTRTQAPTPLVALVEARGLQSAVWISSLDDTSLGLVRDTGTETKLMRVRSWTSYVNVSESWLRETQALGFDAANVNIGAWSQAKVNYAKSLGLVASGWAWPTAGESNNTEAIELGLDMFMTDRLDDLHQKLGR